MCSWTIQLNNFSKFLNYKILLHTRSTLDFMKLLHFFNYRLQRKKKHNLKIYAMKGRHYNLLVMQFIFQSVRSRSKNIILCIFQRRDWTINGWWDVGYGCNAYNIEWYTLSLLSLRIFLCIRKNFAQANNNVH